ncbi:hypothetical protein AB5J49_01880 [Streptomyces sp. R28]|uniref:Uncharacterized protein n=1 Tax=Streptomyces sp. R28 TaxID=3238628 RepID=A0AB39PRL8_9ACTN
MHDAGPYENGRRYVLMSRLRGENLAGAWDRVPRVGRERLVAEIGEAPAVFHALDAARSKTSSSPGTGVRSWDRQRTRAGRGAAARARSADRLAGADPGVPPFDSEPTMIGARAYDFAGVGLFVTRGDPRLLTRLTKSYGATFAPAELPAYTPLHVHRDIPWCLRELGAPAAGSLPSPASPAETWFGSA